MRSPVGTISRSQDWGSGPVPRDLMPASEVALLEACPGRKLWSQAGPTTVGTCTRAEPGLPAISSCVVHNA